ncbi:MAG: hypothetical protein KKF16_08610 [Euryarchaeota archaeon]|nr:hypothetical protein [Euryarchaeota archaeon]MBU4608009.1 hypothetical protein [Euryarchaeota archaeon]MBV1728652.1 hypothetical protein [Methanobacterium sp.]MBV1754734.1 hypothetical protein [Methanobacterium sp.]
MSPKKNELPIERIQCIYCGSFFRTDEYDEVCLHCEEKIEDGKKLIAKFKPEIIYFENFQPEIKNEIKLKKSVDREYLNEKYGEYKPLKDVPKFLEHEKIESNYSHYFIARYRPKYKNPDLFSRKIFPRFKSIYEYVYEPEAREFAKYLIKGIKDSRLDFDVIVPVPSSSGMVARSQRLLTDLLSKKLTIENGTDYLKRVQHIRKPKFSGKDRPSVDEHLASLTCDDKVSGKRVLLFDDIYTSGNTVKSCIKILEENKASYVVVVTLAKTIGW